MQGQQVKVNIGGEHHITTWDKEGGPEAACLLCGSGFVPAAMAITLYVNGEPVGPACPECLRLGLAGAREILHKRAAAEREMADWYQSHAQWSHTHAEDLSTLCDNLTDLPTFETWLSAEQHQP